MIFHANRLQTGFLYSHTFVSCLRNFCIFSIIRSLKSGWNLNKGPSTAIPTSGLPILFIRLARPEIKNMLLKYQLLLIVSYVLTRRP